MLKSIILLPTYNEKENIITLVPEIFSSHPDIHILVIDDNSPDGTADTVRLQMKTYPNLRLLSRPGKQGLGVAYKHGLQYVLQDKEIDRVIMMDADGSHAVVYIHQLLRASENNDFVIGSRYVKGGAIENWEKWRFLLSRYGNLYARTLSGLPVRDITAGFLCFNASLLRIMDLDGIGASGYAFLMNLKFSAIREARARVIEVPITFMCRREGESKISHHIIREGLKTPLQLFVRRFHL
jgi:dolichol-phosphate mannosyltransferase